MSKGPSGWLSRLAQYQAVWRSPDFIAAALTLLLTTASWLTGAAGSGPEWLAPALGLVGTAIGGAKIAVGAGRGFMNRELNVDELVTIAIVAAVIMGEYLSAGLVAFMMLFGKVLEDFTAERAELALAGLGSLLPATARRRTAEETEDEVPLTALVRGDVVIVRPGERIPIDGEILVGQAVVDQAALTGEPVPLPRGPGDEVLAGSLAHQGTLEVRTNRVGAATAVGRIRQLVAAAEGERAPVVRRADYYAKFFTPAVLALAAGVLLITRDWLPAVTVLVVACPCALVLATPTAVIAGVVNAARHGLLIKSGARLEAAGRVTTVAFDKTGTLTLGRPVVVRTMASSGQTELELLSLAAAVERRSEHPLAYAIVTAASEVGGDGQPSADPDSFRAVPGRGAEAMVRGRQVVVGSLAWLDDLGVAVAAAEEAAWSEHVDRGETILGIGIDGRLAGALAVADTPRDEAASMIGSLRDAGTSKIMLLTGDSQAAAGALAQQVGIPPEDVRAGLLPEDKVEVIKSLQDRGEVVAMIGDGVNDAPALASADVAIAVGVGGTDVALEVSDVALLTADLSQIASALRLSRHTLSTIRQNLGLALAWN
ncbi:MAG: cadmium-translocating P-type ATPase, partial [Dehalococcoidia bacterium]|nr:cadmium-translocating P-type ATPase [Dehalococcoidia bacterium]